MSTTSSAEPLAPERAPAEKAPPRRRRSRSLLQVVVLVLALMFFGVPAFGYLLGVRAQQIENRPLSSRPKLSEGWQVFPHLTRWTSDHLPFRDSAVRANSSVDEALFGEPPAFGNGGRPEVITAPNGWLFWAQDLQWACSPTQSVEETLRNADRLAQMIRSTGARYALLVPPDKTSIETNELPARYPGKACGQAAKHAFWSQIEAAPPQGYADLYRPLLDLRAQAGQPIYKSKDTHWAPQAAALYARTVTDAIQPGLWEPQALVPTGRKSQLGDLTRITGLPSDNSFDGWAVRRPGVRAYPDVPFRGGKVGSVGVARITTTSTAGAPLVGGETLVLGDSFNGVSQPLVAPYFSNITTVSINSAPHDAKAVAKMILSSRTVVVESVERAFATGRAPLFSDAFLNDLQKELDAQRSGARKAGSN